jgi:hypothetical protein
MPSQYCHLSLHLADSPVVNKRETVQMTSLDSRQPGTKERADCCQYKGQISPVLHALAYLEEK